MNDNQGRDQIPRKDPVFDHITGNNRVVILIGGALGIVTAFAASRGLITPNSAIPSFGWIVFGLLVSELVFGYVKKIPPSQLVSMPGRILALVAGLGTDVIGRSALGVV